MNIKTEKINLPSSWEFILKNNDERDFRYHELSEIYDFMKRNYKDYYCAETEGKSFLGKFQGIEQDLKTYKIYMVCNDKSWHGKYNSTKYTVRH